MQPPTLPAVALTSLPLCLSRSVHNYINKTMHILCVCHVVDSTRSLCPWSSCILEAMYVESEHRAYDVQEDIFGAVEKRNLQPHNEGESQLVPNILEPVRVIQKIVIPDIDKVDGSVHDPIRQPLRIILASTNRAPRRLFAFFIILVLIISFGWYLCYNCG